MDALMLYMGNVSKNLTISVTALTACRRENMVYRSLVTAAARCHCAETASESWDFRQAFQFVEMSSYCHEYNRVIIENDRQNMAKC
jgi:hypothetical protein